MIEVLRLVKEEKKNERNTQELGLVHNPTPLHEALLKESKLLIIIQSFWSINSFSKKRTTYIDMDT